MPQFSKYAKKILTQMFKTFGAYDHNFKNMPNNVRKFFQNLELMPHFSKCRKIFENLPKYI
jgi:hypothetical protein